MLIDFKEFAKWPPFLICGLARKPNVSLTMRAMATASGLPLRTFCRISSKLSWDGVKHENIEPFCRGCCFDAKHISKEVSYLRSTAKADVKFAHLKGVRRTTFDRRLAKWMKL